MWSVPILIILCNHVHILSTINTLVESITTFSDTLGCCQLLDDACLRAEEACTSGMRVEQKGNGSQGKHGNESVFRQVAERAEGGRMSQ